MSYILDALRKSETERRQGKVPELGQQVQLIHTPKKKRVSATVWIALALLINAVVVAVVFWPKAAPERAETAPAQAAEPARPVAPEPASRTPLAVESPVPAERVDTQSERFGPHSEPALAEPPVPAFAPVTAEKPTIIVPSPSTPSAAAPGQHPADPPGRVPHLVELPVSFQRSIPDLTFNSHIYASDPQARRVMINDHYLRPGDRFGQLRVEQITEDGVVLSKHGQHFRVGIVRDWVSPR